MKRFAIGVIVTCGLTVLIFVIFFGEIFDPFDSREQMDAAKKYMDSLTEKDIQAWIQRAQTDLEADNPMDFTTRDASPDLQKLGMTGIEENSNYIDYMWLGGMDYTALEVKLISNGVFRVTAIYTPYSNRILWPK